MNRLKISKSILPFILLAAFCPATVLVDGIHGWTIQYGEPLEALFPETDFDYFTAADLPLEEILSSGTLGEEDVTIPIYVPPGVDVLYLRYEFTNPEIDQSPWLYLVDPNDEFAVQLFNGCGYLENPEPGEWQLIWNAYEELTYEVGIGPHFYTLSLLQNYDFVLQLLDNTYSFFTGYCPPLTDYELETTTAYLSTGGGFLLSRETDFSMVDKPVIRIYAEEPVTFDLALNFPGRPTYLKPEADFSHSDQGHEIHWDNVEVVPGEYTEILYEGRPQAPLALLTAAPHSGGASVVNRSDQELGTVHLFQHNGEGFLYGKGEQLQAQEEQNISWRGSYSGTELLFHLINQLVTEGLAAGLTEDEMDVFWRQYPWVGRWLSLATLSGGICAVTSFQGADYDRMIGLDSSVQPTELVRKMWVFTDNLPADWDDPPLDFPFDPFGAQPLESRERLVIHEYGVVEERFPGNANQNRLMSFFDLVLEDDIIVDETDNYMGDSWSPLFHTFGDHEVAQLLTIGVNQVQSIMAAPIVISDLTTQIPIITGDDDTHCEYSDQFPPGSYPAVAAAREIGEGRLLVINDRDILVDTADNLQFLENVFNWLSGPAGELGDVNQDSAVNVQDIVILVNIITGFLEPTPYQLWSGDLNGDTALNVLDVVLIVNIIIGPPQLPDECYLEPEVGPCDGICPRFFYNPDTGQCDMFYWGCCEGVVPFETMEDCEAACE